MKIYDGQLPDMPLTIEAIQSKPVPHLALSNPTPELKLRNLDQATKTNKE